MIICFILTTSRRIYILMNWLGLKGLGPGEGWGGGYSRILAIRVCAAGKGMVFKPFSLV